MWSRTRRQGFSRPCHTSWRRPCPWVLTHSAFTFPEDVRSLEPSPTTPHAAHGHPNRTSSPRRASWSLTPRAVQAPRREQVRVQSAHAILWPSRYSLAAGFIDARQHRRRHIGITGAAIGVGICPQACLVGTTSSCNLRASSRARSSCRAPGESPTSCQLPIPMPTRLRRASLIAPAGTSRPRKGESSWTHVLAGAAPVAAALVGQRRGLRLQRSCESCSRSARPHASLTH